MPYSRFAVDALGVITIILVSILVLVGLYCILYLIYFHTKIRGQGYNQLGYFHGPWIIRITFILFAIWWGFGEVVRLNLIRGDGRLLNALSFRWQEIVCKCYIVSSLGFAEPCLYLSVVFLLRASLQKSGTLSQKWNGKTVGYILLFCLPVFALQLVLILAGPQFKKKYMVHLPHYFTSPVARSRDDVDVALCTYPLFNTFCLGLFAIMLTSYLFWLGGRILHLVINRSLQKRVYMLVVSVSAFFPIRVLLLGLTVKTQPEHLPFQALAFLGFVSFFFCIGMGMFMLIIMPMRDCLALKKSSERDIEARRRLIDEQNDTVSLIVNQSTLGGSMVSSPGRNSAASTKRGSISFRTTDKDATSGVAFVELSVFSPSQHSTPPGSPQLLGWPMLPPSQAQGPL
ncbi:uncharacterized protein LOC129885925 [Solanum dulcamara]|uniref:uncharacterized protein LOC129885925 n=1 Tax=Solanum dulcamara TaxID=45834 RepID=UPI0024858D6E|nr:uncharacterized protein LOC129885925 [Solanum dulcamara]XP_055816387.1 uncharacterized protein LOC129885925 [Solanum dulcamara]